MRGAKSLSISAPHITTQKAIGFKSQGKIKTGHTESSSHFAQQTSDLGFIWQSRTNEGHDHTTILLPHMTTPEGVVFSTPQGVEVTVKAPSQIRLLTNWHQSKGGFFHQKRNSDLENALVVLETTPETAWIKSLRHNPAVNWHLVSEVHKEWNETTQGLAPGAGALISLAVAIATQGWGSGLMGPGLLTSVAKGLAISAKTVGIMVDAGLTTLLSQTATSLIGNQFDLSKTFQQLMSKESLLALGTSIGTAGLTFGLSDQLGVSLNGTDFFDRLQRSAVQTGSSTTLRILTDDLDVSEALQQGVVNVVAMSVGGWAANHIGEMYHPTPILLQDGTLVVPESSIGWLEHKGLHFGLGFLEGMVSDLKHPLRGAWGGGFGGVGGEILMEEMAPSPHVLQLKASRGTLTQSDLLEFKTHLERSSDIARLGTAFASFMLGQDVNASILTATNAIENNFLQAFVHTLSLYQHQIDTMDEGVQKTKEIAETEVGTLKKMQKGTLELAEDNLRNWKRASSTGLKGALELVATGHKQGEWSEIIDQAHHFPTKVGETTLLVASIAPAEKVVFAVKWGIKPLVKIIQGSEWAINSLAKMFQLGERIPAMAIVVGQLTSRIETQGLLQLEHLSKAPSLPQVRLNYQAGRQFQNEVHHHLMLPENDMIYSVLVRGKGTSGTRPDLPVPLAGVTDIKDVRYITFTKQLQAQATVARQEKTSFNLIISPNTQKISKQLWNAIGESGGKIFEFNPTTEKMVERIVEGNKVLR